MTTTKQTDKSEAAKTDKPKDLVQEVLQELESAVINGLCSIYLTKWFIPRALYNQAKLVSTTWPVSYASTAVIEAHTKLGDTLKRLSEDLDIFSRTLLNNSVVEMFSVEMGMLSDAKAMVKKMLGETPTTADPVKEPVNFALKSILASANQRIAGLKLFD